MLFAYSSRAVWIVLCGLTVFSVAFSHGVSWRSSASILAVLIAAAKTRLVILNFMESRHALPHWRLLYDVWNFAAAATIIVGYILSLNELLP